MRKTTKIGLKKYLVTLFTLLAIISLSLPVQAAFTDTDEHVYQNAIEFIESRGVVQGYDDGTFRPDQTVNRAELLKIVLQSNYSDSELNEYSDDNCFDDVKANEWYTKYVCLGEKEGVVQGYPDGTFKPSQEVNFVEALKILQISYNIPYTESSGSQWFKSSVENAIEINMIPLDIARFDRNISRAQMADMLTRLIKYNEGSLDNYLGIKKYYSVSYEDLEENRSNDGVWIDCEKGIASDCPTEYIIESDLFADSLVSVTGNPNECETLIENGHPEDKIDIVFIAEGGIEYDIYKAYIEGLFMENTSDPSFLNEPFGDYYEQFNFYSIWKAEDFECMNGDAESPDCYPRINELASLCPINSAYDGITLLFPVSENFSNAGWGRTDLEECTQENAYSGRTFELSTGEEIEINECPGMTKMHGTIPGRYNNLIHEWKHMIAALSHDDMTLPNSEQTELICENISGGSDITYEECLEF